MSGPAEPRKRTKVLLSKSVQVILLLVGAALLAPMLAMGLQSTTHLEEFHNRTLVIMPSNRTFWRDPAHYFAGLNAWLSDRVYPIIAATGLRNQIIYFALGASPAANVTVARDGLVFLNGNDAEHPNDLVEGACARAAEPGSRAAFAAALGLLAAWIHRHATPIDVVIVPTVPLLYGDRLPRSFPAALRAACAAGPAGRAPLSNVAVPEGFHLVYPFAALEALRDDSAMFPLGDFHPDGLSVTTVTNRYLDAVGAPAPRLILESSSAPSEVLAYQGVIAPFPVYAVRGSGAAVDTAAAAAVQAAVLPFYDGSGESAHVYRNPAAPDPRAVLILSDSYGYNQGISFAAAFHTVVQLPAPDRDVGSLVAAVRTVVPIDRLVLVFNDSNSGRVVDLTADLDQHR